MTGHLIENIEEYNKFRIPEMLALKYEAMTENAYRFYRATNHLFYAAVSNANAFNHSPNAWLCGDLHLENFGSFRSDNTLVYFDLNDFDEAILGPVTWEIARLITSIFVGFASLKIEEKKALNMAELFLKTYLNTLLKTKAVTIETRNATGIVGDFLLKASSRKPDHLLQKRTRKHRNKLEILMDHQKHVVLPGERKAKIEMHVQEWLKNDARSPYNYRVIDSCFRIAGTSSLGLHRYVILLKSSNGNGQKYVLIDMKESIPSTLQPYLGLLQPAWPSEAERVIAIQERMQDRCPALLSTSEFEGRSYLMQEMQPEEDNINFQLLAHRYRDMYTVIDNMAMLTASAQLRSSGRQGSANADALREWAQKFSENKEMIDYCRHYSKTVEADYRYYCAQYASGVIR